jgi:hypothetical protein
MKNQFTFPKSNHVAFRNDCWVTDQSNAVERRAVFAANIDNRHDVVVALNTAVLTPEATVFKEPGTRNPELAARTALRRTGEKLSFP